MKYFDGVEILDCAVMPRCVAALDQSFPGICSVEFIRAGRMSFGVDGGPRRVLDFPALFWHHPSHSYQYGAVDGDGWEHRYVTMRGPLAWRLLEEGFMPLSPSGFFPVGDPEAVDALFGRIVSLGGAKTARSHGEIFVELERLLCLLAGEVTCRAASGTPHAALVLALAERMTDSPGDVFDLDAEARRGGLSYSHFRRLFSQLTGQPPHDYLLSRRVAAAARALCEGGECAKEIAARLGFADPVHFCKSFKRRLGLSPGEYRRARLMNESG